MRSTFMHVMAAASAATALHVQSNIRAGTVRARGVNLGGWLVAEQWMTWDSPIWNGVPADVSGQGEYRTMVYRGAAAGQAAFDAHRRTWIMEGHIQRIAASGLNLVRVPVGYWIQGCVGLPLQLANDCAVYATGSLLYLDVLVRDWALKHNVAVLVSVHAAPGSQNGADHSAPASPGAHWSDSDENVAATRRLVAFLADRYLLDEAFLGISLLNEPAGATDVNVLTRYYESAYDDVRNVVGSDCILVTAPLLWCQSSGVGGCHMQDFGPDMTNVWHDWHPYVVWGYEAMTEDQIIAQGVGGWAAAIRAWKGRHPLFLGEWCFTGPGGKFMTDASARALVRAMVGMVEGAVAGWTAWSWRMAGDNTWNGWSLSGLMNAYDPPPSPDPAQDVTPPIALRGVGGYFTGDLTRVNRLLVQDAGWTNQFGVAVLERWVHNRRTLQLRSHRFGDCLDGYFDAGRQTYRVHMWTCGASNANQKWTLERHQVVHVSSLLCLSRDAAGEATTLQRCDATDATQLWTTKERVMLALPMRRRLGVGAQGQLVQTIAPDDNIMWQPPSLIWLIDYEAHSISNVATGKCLTVISIAQVNGANAPSSTVLLQTCERGLGSQQWRVDHLNQHLVFQGRYCLTVEAAAVGQLKECDAASLEQRIRLDWLSYPDLA